MTSLDLNPFAYGILELTNPSEWQNDGGCDEFSHLLTGKSVYVWPLIFASYIWHLEKRKGILFPKELERIDEYIRRHFEHFLVINPVDFSNAGGQYVRAKPGSFQALRKDFGTPAKKVSIPDAEKRLGHELRELEANGLIVDPFAISVSGLTLAVLGAVPYSFSLRTDKGDKAHLKVKAMLWEFESLSKDEQREIRFHFFMEKAISTLKKHVRLLVAEED